MEKIIESIQNAGREEIERILHAAAARYQELYPDWEVSVLSLEKAVDKNAQIDAAIALLEKLKNR